MHTTIKTQNNDVSGDIATETGSESVSRLRIKHERFVATAGGSVVGGAFFGGSLAGYAGALAGSLLGLGVAYLATRRS